eukprot:CAMPEP_0204336736 /NCGR_PEP_ID=MMETSP0469-20131031/19760_1 /ASSEMBLY_ACC=CAM_ASM_000384 /TAXON_ID=2969 /ORGANISM="Oxyrrhis marina" /LENGTH=65 /DNA_ID=CAMNT_0051320651 /DNA_START=25 /DNA_END=222 /DNA_ORIENTATION=-
MGSLCTSVEQPQKVEVVAEKTRQQTVDALNAKLSGDDPDLPEESGVDKASRGSVKDLKARFERKA